MPHQRGTRRVASPPLLHSDAPSVAAPWDTHTNRDLAGCPSLPSLPNGGAVASKLLKHLPAAAAGSGREQRSLKTWMPPRRTTLPSPPHAVDRTARIHAIRTHCPHTLRCVGHGACSMLSHMLRSTTGGRGGGGQPTRRRPVSWSPGPPCIQSSGIQSQQGAPPARPAMTPRAVTWAACPPGSKAGCEAPG